MNRDPINAALDNDPAFREKWKAFRPRWRADVPSDDRNIGIFRRRVIDQVEADIDAGIHDPKQLTDRACEGMEMVVITIVVRLLIEALVRSLLKRRGILKPDRVGGKGKRK